MNPRLLLSLVVVLAGSYAAAFDAAAIRRVTLYPGSATVERVAKVSAGATGLEVGDLPAGFDVRTIRIDADAGIRLGEFSVRDVARTDAVHPRQAELEAKIQNLGDQMALLEVERQSAELVTLYLKGLGAPAEAGKPVSLEARALGATLEAIRHGGADAFARQHKVAIQKRELEKQQAVLQQELEKLAGQGRDSRIIRLSLAADRAGEIRISYQLNGPGWQPVYRAMLDTDSGQVQIERQAVIAQASGEDWRNVALRLSTGQPRSNPQGPAPRPWSLSLPEPVYLERAAAAPLAAKAQPSLARMALNEAEALFDVNEVQGAFATEFEVPASVSLPADGRKVTVSLGRQSLPMKLRVQAVPRQDTAAFLIAAGAQPQGVWLPGEVQLYRDGAYVGATHWRAQDGKQLELPFGRDDLVRVTASHGKTLSGSGGFLEQRRERQIAVEYTVQNRHRQPVDLVLLEPTPFSTHEQIKVETRFAPKPAQENWEGMNGVVAWVQTLPAGATQTFSVTSQIAWPKDRDIVGLPR